MAEFPALPLWTDAYLGDTTHLTTIEHGAYLLLLMSMWRNDGSLPDDDRILARYCRVTASQWARISVAIRPFLKSKDGRITQGRLSDELTFVKQKSVRQSDSAKSRWLKTKDICNATAMPLQCQTNAPTPTPTPTPIEAKASRQKPRKRLPDGWVPNQRNMQDAADRGFTERDAENEADKFRDYHIAKGTAFADWDAGWRSWIGRARPNAGGNARSGSAHQNLFDGFQRAALRDQSRSG